jgi:hypothetical protein
VGEPHREPVEELRGLVAVELRGVEVELRGVEVELRRLVAVAMVHRLDNVLDGPAPHTSPAARGAMRTYLVFGVIEGKLDKLLARNRMTQSILGT